MAGRAKSGRNTAPVQTKGAVFVAGAYRKHKTKSPAWEKSQAGNQMKVKLLSEARGFSQASDNF